MNFAFAFDCLTYGLVLGNWSVCKFRLPIEFQSVNRLIDLNKTKVKNIKLELN